MGVLSVGEWGGGNVDPSLSRRMTGWVGGFERSFYGLNPTIPALPHFVIILRLQSRIISLAF